MSEPKPEDEPKKSPEEEGYGEEEYGEEEGEEELA